MTGFGSLREFYPFYLREHRDRTCRRLHVLGSSAALLCLLVAFMTGRWQWVLAALSCGCGFAWAGHLFFEKNRPATFSHPLYSFAGDWVMFKDILTGRIRF